MALGFLAFVLGVILSPQRAWQSYFVNFLFWSGIAQGGVVMAAVYRITNARWGDQFRRIGEGMVLYLPVSLVLYVILIAGGSNIFPWLGHHDEQKGVWLSSWFLFGRDGIAFGLLAFLSYRYVYHAVRPDLGILKENGIFVDQRVLRAIRDWRGWEAEVTTSKKKLAVMTPVLLICFGTLYSLIGFDMVMALDPHWYSTLYGWMYALHAFFAALTVITILAYLSTKWFGLGENYSRNQWHDMGRFVFGFALLAGGFFWSQFLVIWYGNLPEETSYLIKRFYAQPWEPLMWAYIILAYLFPLVVFLSARVKQIPGALAAIAALIFAALFLERFIAVVPFLWNLPSIPFGLLEIGITIGFVGLFLRCWLAFVRVIPIIPARAMDQTVRTLGSENPSAVS
jgi:Ni/Fe-hydrogenase subunit HybB-like protein